MRKLAPFIGEVPDIVISDGVVHFSIGDTELCCATLATYRKGLARANRVMAEHDAHCAEVVLLRVRGER